MELILSYLPTFNFVSHSEEQILCMLQLFFIVLGDLYEVSQLFLSVVTLQLEDFRFSIICFLLKLLFIYFLKAPCVREVGWPKPEYLIFNVDGLPRK